MTIALWAVQSALALLFIAGATTRAGRYEFAKRQMAWVGAIPRPLLVAISAAEIAGGIGLILPGLTHIAVVVTPIAALSLAVVQVLAIGFHWMRHEQRFAGGNAALLGALVFIGVGRLALAAL